MKTKLKKLFPWLCAILVIVSMAAASKQMMGPTQPVTANAVVRWKGTSGWQTTNSVVIIDDLGNISGVGTQTVQSLNIVVGTVTNGIQYLQHASAPTAADIGGSVGVSTNFLVRAVSGQLIVYWSDGMSGPYSKILAP